MPDQITRTPSASMEEVSSLTGDDQTVLNQAKKEKLTGWYPFDDRLNGLEAIAIAQRANAAYSERLLNVNGNVWLSTTVLWSCAAVIASLIVGLSLPEFLLGVALPLLPALLDVWEQYRSTRRAGLTRRTMASDIEAFVRGQSSRQLAAEDLLVWQSQVYDLRRTSPQIPNLVYKGMRDRNERAMNAAATELAEAALRHSAGGTSPGGH
ncbi:hypothetical protein GCM10009789_11280 [Kribbella sancticallisti]|uniref:SLATT domain-containing protein n=2 Tax=Kribbella sancticallisti TaxID=460087 RepID=A0ABP4NCU1_9ACTN